MSKNRVALEVCTQFLFLACGFLLTWFVKNELIVALGILVLLALNFSIKYYRREGLVFIMGMTFGVMTEIGLSRIYKMQFWKQGLLFGVPAWLPLAWGYGFVVIRRIGNLIVRD